MNDETLVYKMTHQGDPNFTDRTWGASDCLGSKRDGPFANVIGVAGKTTGWCGPNSKRLIALRLVWIGLGKKAIRYIGRGHVYTFEHFYDARESGILLRDIAPELARKMYVRNARMTIHERGFACSLPIDEEIRRLLVLAITAN
jgi:hypothetical protein